MLSAWSTWKKQIASKKWFTIEFLKFSSERSSFLSIQIKTNQTPSMKKLTYLIYLDYNLLKLEII